MTFRGFFFNVFTFSSFVIAISFAIWLGFDLPFLRQAVPPPEATIAIGKIPFPSDAATVAQRERFDGSTAYNYVAVLHNSPADAINDAGRRMCNDVGGRIEASPMTPEMIDYFPGGYDKRGINPPPTSAHLTRVRLTLERSTFVIVSCKQAARSVYIPIFVAATSVIHPDVFSDHLTPALDLSIGSERPETYSDLIHDAWLQKAVKVDAFDFSPLLRSDHPDMARR